MMRFRCDFSGGSYSNVVSHVVGTVPPHCLCVHGIAGTHDISQWPNEGGDHICRGAQPSLVLFS